MTTQAKEARALSALAAGQTVNINGIAVSAADIAQYLAAKTAEAARKLLGINPTGGFVVSAATAQGTREMRLAVGIPSEPSISPNGRAAFINESYHFGHGAKVFTLEVKAYEFVSRDPQGNPRAVDYKKQVEKDTINEKWLGEF